MIEFLLGLWIGAAVGALLAGMCRAAKSEPEDVKQIETVIRKCAICGSHYLDAVKGVL